VVSAGEAADNSLTLASANTVRLLAAPLLRPLANFSVSKGCSCPTGVNGQGTTTKCAGVE
jgi:hypothetical protein